MGVTCKLTERKIMLIKTNKENFYLLSPSIPQVLLLHPILAYLIRLYESGIDLKNWMNSFEINYINFEGKKIKVDKDIIRYYYEYFMFLKEHNYFNSKKTVELEKVKHYHAENIKFYLANTDQISFEVTDSCNMISKYKIKSFVFFPFFNGRNINFFKKNVFIDKKAILESFSSMKDIFIRKTLNKFMFRKLIILSDKKIYGNINNPSIGKLNQDSMLNIIAKELNKGTSWRKVRKNVWPCKMCVFDSLCPSISNYEYVIGKWNLCNIYGNET